MTLLSTRYILAFVTFRKTLQLVTLLVSCVLLGLFVGKIFLLDPRVYCAKLNLCLKKKKEKKKTVYHIGVHIVQSNSTFQHQWLEFFGVVKYCLLC